MTLFKSQIAKRNKKGTSCKSSGSQEDGNTLRKSPKIFKLNKNSDIIIYHLLPTLVNSTRKKYYSVILTV